MAGVSFQDLEQVDIFDLLSLDPSGKNEDPKQLRKAYKKAMFAVHPDKTGPNIKATQLNQLKEFLCDFDASDCRIGHRIEELFRRGKHHSRGRDRVSRSMLARRLARRLAKPGSSSWNPIVIDTPEIGAPAPPAVSSSNPKEKCKTRTKQHRRCRDRWFSEYHPSRESEWRPAPYADQSDTEVGWS
ncbi:hypothetical protein GP486_002203 [Trichoglossum hirsutum]|uniref:J domain-containing protein n=1 Tax=Trichoglossum hirsutum TaxID=265104 RepID=A0A9P8LFN9_9PEZI|nr:hypothetical protein GP486_002203 [Trichoglossum hirsutum]